MNPEIYSMMYELVMRQFFGDKAYGIAGTVKNRAKWKRWLNKAIKEMEKRVNSLEIIDTRLKEVLISHLESTSRHLKQIKNDEDNLVLIWELLFICSYLLGYDWTSGEIYRTPHYYQTLSEAKANHRHHKRIDMLEAQKEENNLIGIKRRTAQDLKKEGLETYQISLILNTTEYQVLKLINNQ